MIGSTFIHKNKVNDIQKNNSNPVFNLTAERIQVVETNHSTRDRFIIPTIGLRTPTKLLAYYESDKNF